MSADRSVEFLLVGGGVASAHCAAELRALGAEGEIAIVGREADPPYDRPPVSKDCLRGESGREDAHVHPLGWYEENGVELLTGTNVMSLDPAARTAKLQTKEEISSEKVLIATGAMVNILRVDGAQLDGIHYLRAFGNADSIRDNVGSAEHVAIIGGSYIGTEVAASLKSMGKQCTIVMLEEVALSGAFGDEVGRYFYDLLEANGVGLFGGQELVAFESDERVSKLLTASGHEVECDAVVIGAGVRPDAMLAQKAGLDVDDGIVCDARLETSAPGIFAGGDCCSYESVVHGRRLRVEHWDVALQQGRHVAKAMLGEQRAFDEVPYFFSDLAHWASLEYVGPAEDWDEVLWRGDREQGESTAWYLQGERVVAALTVGRSEDLVHARRLLAERTDVSGHRNLLTEHSSDLADVS